MPKFNRYLLLLVLITLVPLFDFFHSGLPLTHDGRDHVVRIANFSRSLSEGNLLPRWAGRLNWGYGHPVLMFLYPASSYLGSAFHFFGFSFVDSTKIVFALGFVLSAVFMFLWIKETWGNGPGLVAGLSYAFAPYRFVDLYVRGAIGENLAFVWPPLICFFFLKLSKKYKPKYLIGAAVSLALLVLSHNALSLMFIPLTLVYILYLTFFTSKKNPYFILYSIFSILLGFALSAFFWLPALIEGKYTLRNIVTSGNIVGFESISRLLNSPWNYGGTGSMSVQLGLWQWFFILSAPLAIYLLFKRRDHRWLWLTCLMGIFLIAIFLILPLSLPVYLALPILQQFQFAWRFLSLALLPPAVFGGGLVFLLSRKRQRYVVPLLILGLILANRPYWRAQSFLQKDESFYSGVYAGTTDTGESAPRWSVRFMESYPAAPLEVIEGEAKIEPLVRLSNRHEYKVQAVSPVRLVENTLYFPGWQVLSDGEPLPLEFQDPNFRGLMTFRLPAGEHALSVNFSETKLRRAANSLSAVALLVLISLAGLRYINDFRRLSRL